MKKLLLIFISLFLIGNLSFATEPKPEASEKLVNKIIEKLENLKEQKKDLTWKKLKTVCESISDKYEKNTKKRVFWDELTYEVSRKHGMENKTWESRGIDRFLHNPEDYTVTDVSEQYRQGERDFYIQKIYDKDRKTDNPSEFTFENRVENMDMIVWKVCKKKDNVCNLLFDTQINTLEEYFQNLADLHIEDNVFALSGFDSMCEDKTDEFSKMYDIEEYECNLSGFKFSDMMYQESNRKVYLEYRDRPSGDDGLCFDCEDFRPEKNVGGVVINIYKHNDGIILSHPSLLLGKRGYTGRAYFHKYMNNYNVFYNSLMRSSWHPFLYKSKPDGLDIN